MLSPSSSWSTATESFFPVSETAGGLPSTSPVSSLPSCTSWTTFCPEVSPYCLGQVSIHLRREPLYGTTRRPKGMGQGKSVEGYVSTLYMSEDTGGSGPRTPETK